MALAFLAGLVTATRRAKLVNVHADIIADVTLWLMIGGIVGARVVYVTTYWKTQFAHLPFSEVFMVQHGGLVYYGGLIGSSLAGIVYLSWKKAPVWKIGDIMAPSVALGCVLGRIGCLLNGCCYGYACDLPWAIHFPATHETEGAAVHPTELYDALLNLILYIWLAWMFRARRKFDGQIFALLLMVYAIFRSIAEHFRGDYPKDHIHGGFITSAQLLSIPIFLVGLGLYVWLSRRPVVKRG